MSKILTVGMAVYGEFESVWATIEGLRANHGENFELVIVDNAPEGCVRTHHVTAAAGGTYYHRPDLAGTSKPRDACFQFAKTPWVLVCDSHVIFENGAIDAAVDYCRANPTSRDILAGPIVGDDGRWTATHWNQPHSPGLWGTWQLHPSLYDVWNGPAFAQRGAAAVRRSADMVPPFEIHSMGLGCFAMRREVWPGFNPLFRGFGGEEGYIHEKVRQLGGKALCLPRLRWRHRFRDVVDWKHSPQPYPSSSEDHVFNMIAGHLELGIDPAVIREHFGKKLPPDTWAVLEKAARAAQPFGQLTQPARQRILGVWYTNNAAPEGVLRHSLATIKAAADQSRYDVTVVTCPWAPVPGNPFREVLAKLDGRKGHAAIVQQISQAARAAVENHEIGTGEPFDAVVYLEHDVLYPPGYFDLMGDAFANNPAADVVVNLDYEGLNGTGWLKVRERHEPMHQIGMRWHKAVANHTRTKAECDARGWCYMEPDSDPVNGGPADRSRWVRLPVRGFAPAVHINHEHRLTSHGEVVYYQDAGGRTIHPFWGDVRTYWPQPVAAAPAGCNSCGGAPVPDAFAPADLEDYYEAAKARPSDFNEHMATLRELADGCDVVAEISRWDDKPAVVALAASKAKTVRSYATAPKPRVWAQLDRLAAGRFVKMGPAAVPVVDPCDLLFIDTTHNAEALFPLLDTHAAQVRRYIVIHCTETYGANGDDGKMGVMPAIRGFLDRNRRWTVIRQDRHNHGLVVMSCDDRDKRTPPGMLTKALNFSMALAAHAKDGAKLVSRERWELRMAECLTCPHRVHDACALCGCPVDKKASWNSSECPDKPARWPADATQGDAT